MKSFSEIRNKLKDYGYLGETHIPSQDPDKIEELSEENWGVGVQPYQSVDTVEKGNLLNLEDEASFNQLNAFVGSVSHRDYIDPQVAVRNLQNKLQMIGLHFQVNESANYYGGTLQFPLYRFGVISGMNPDGSYVNGLKEIEEGGSYSYILEMNFTKLLNGLTSISAIVKKI